MVDYELVIFDCDGVLVDSEMLSCECLAGLLRECGYPYDAEAVADQFLGRSLASIIAGFAASGHALPSDFAARLSGRIRETFVASLRPIPGIADALQRLDRRFCVASSSDSARVALSLDVTGLADIVCGRVFTAEMVAHGKPAPDLFLYAAKQMAADPRRTLVIEDSVIGVEAAKAAGMTVWGFVGGAHHSAQHGRRKLEAAGAARIFDRMADFVLPPFEVARGVR